MVHDARGPWRRALRNGVTLMEVIVTVAILGVLASVIFVGVETSSRLGGEAKRIRDAARVLADLRNASVRYNNGVSALFRDTSFTADVSGSGLSFGGVNPGRLSHLTTKITTSDLNSCGYTYAAGQTGLWSRNYYGTPISSTTPFHVADGFLADDVLQRFDSTGAAKKFTRPAGTDSAFAPGTLAIVMQNVAISDARALAALMEGDQSGGSSSIVRFTANGNSPITVFYHMTIHGC